MLKNVLTRYLGSAPMLSSRGGTSILTAQMVPSDGFTIRDGSEGTARFGFRKKYAQNRVRIRKSQANIAEKNTKISVAPRPICMNLYPSLWIERLRPMCPVQFIFDPSKTRVTRKFYHTQSRLLKAKVGEIVGNPELMK
jgi:hypothetical protein